MHGATAQDRTRFRFGVPRDAILPRGNTEMLVRTVAHLGPFRVKTISDGRKVGALTTSFCGSEFVVCEETAVWLVRQLAESYNISRHLYDTAPRSKFVLESLDRLGRCSSALANVLAELDDIVLTQLHDLRKSATVQTYTKANGQALPQASGADYQDLDSPQWIERLRALEELARLAAQGHRRITGGDSDDHVDKGGNWNAYGHVMGHPRAKLAREALSIFDVFAAKPGTGTAEGPFHHFLEDLYEFATGTGPDKRKSLVNSVKEAVRARAEYVKVVSQNERIKRKIEQLLTSAPATPERDEAISSLEGQIDPLFPVLAFDEAGNLA